MSEMMHALLERNDVWFEPEDIANLITGFESTLANLGIKDRNARRQLRWPS